MKLLILFFNLLFISNVFAEEIQLPRTAPHLSIDSKNNWYFIANNPDQIYTSKDSGKTWDKFYLPEKPANLGPVYLIDFRVIDQGSFLVSNRNSTHSLSSLKDGELKDIFRARAIINTFYTSDSIFVYTDPHFVMRSQNLGKSWDTIQLNWKLNIPDTLQFIYNRKSGAVFTLIDGQLHGLEKKDSAFSLVTDSPKNLVAFANLSDEVLLCQDNGFKYHLFSFQTKKWESSLKGLGSLKSLSSGPAGLAIEIMRTGGLRYSFLRYENGILTSTAAPSSWNGKYFINFYSLPNDGGLIAFSGDKVFTFAYPASINCQVTGEGVIKVEDLKSGDLFQIDRKRTIRDFCTRGSEIELSAEPEKGYRFVRWVGVPEKEKDQSTIKMKVSTSQLNIEAVFEKIP